jgi:hypothetical protein
MRVAHIVPTAYMQSDWCNTGYQLVLAHELIQDEDYRSGAQSLAERGDFVIVDNGAAETGAAHRFETILDASFNLLPRVSEIVLPDVINDGKATVKRSTQAANDYVSSLPALCGFMAVPQGPDLTTYLWSFDQLVKLPGVRTMGISKYVEMWCPGGRLALVNLLRETYRLQQARIHLLGLHHPLELYLQGKINRDFIDGVDSAFAFHLGARGLYMAYDTQWGVEDHPRLRKLEARPRRPDNFFSSYASLDKDHTKVVDRNIGNMEQWANDF